MSSPAASGSNGRVGAGVGGKGAMGSEWERPGGNAEVNSWEMTMEVVVDVTRGLLTLNGVVDVGSGFPHKSIDKGVSFTIAALMEGIMLTFDKPAEMIGFSFLLM